MGLCKDCGYWAAFAIANHSIDFGERVSGNGTCVQAEVWVYEAPRTSIGEGFGVLTEDGNGRADVITGPEFGCVQFRQVTDEEIKERVQLYEAHKRREKSYAQALRVAATLPTVPPVKDS